MPTPFDLTEQYGEGWCVTLAHLPVSDTLRLMGVAEPAAVPDGPAEPTRRLVSPPSDGHVALVAWPVIPDRPAPPPGPAAPADPGWTMVLELEGTIGWVGADPDLLADLSVEGGTACTIMRDPNRVTVLFAEHGEVSGLEAGTGRRWGPLSTELAVALAEAGVPEDDEDLSPDQPLWTPSQLAALAAQAATGVRLRPELFAGPCLGGLSAGP